MFHSRSVIVFIKGEVNVKGNMCVPHTLPLLATWPPIT